MGQEPGQRTRAELSHQELQQRVQTASMPLGDAWVSAALGRALDSQLHRRRWASFAPDLSEGEHSAEV